MSIRKFTICYCEMHGQGYCLEDECVESVSSIAKIICGVACCINYHENYGYGNLEYDEQNNSFNFKLGHDRACNDWNITHFNNVIFDKYLNQIKLKNTDIVIGLKLN